MDECDALDCLNNSEGLCNTSKKHISKTGQCLSYSFDRARMPPYKKNKYSLPTNTIQ